MTFIILQLVAFTGLFLHWLKKRTKRQTLSSFKDYMIKHWQATRNSVISIFAAIVALYATGDVELTKQTLAIAFGIGYTFDSALNKAPEEQ